MKYHYSLQSASELGIAEHPQAVIRRHFPDARDFRPESLGDCWFFEATEHVGPLLKCFTPFGADGFPDWNYHRGEPR